MENKWKRVLGFLGIQRSMVGLLTMVILVGMGERMAERFLPIYLLALGGGELAVGLLNGLDNLLSALYSFPGGYLADRLGTKKALLVFNGIAMVGFTIVILVPHWWAVIGASFLFLSWTAISLPATMKLISVSLPSNKRTMGVSVHSLVRRIPMALGPVVGGLLIGFYGEVKGIRISFAVALVFALVAMIAQQRLIEEPVSKEKKVTQKPGTLWKEMSPELKGLLASDILIRFCEQIPYAFMAIWAMKTVMNPISAFQFGILTTVEMVVAMLVYIPVAWLADRAGKRPFVAMTFVFFTLFPLVLYYSRSFWPLVGAFALRGLKEFGEPTRKALILDLAKRGDEAATFGLYYLIRDLVVSIAAFGGAFLWTISPAVNLYTAFFFGVAGTTLFLIESRQ